MAAAGHRATREIPSNLSGNISKLVEADFDVLLCFCEDLTGSASARWSVVFVLFKL